MMVVLLQVLKLCSGTFLFSFFVVWLCAFVMPLVHYVVVKVGCN